MANPLKDRATQAEQWVGTSLPRSRDEWRDWCWERNQSAKGKDWQRWMHIRDVDHGNGPTIEVAIIEGDEVADIWAMLRDKPYVPYKWDGPQVRKHFGLVQWRIERGTSPDFFMLWSAENRRQRRNEIIEREISYSTRANGQSEAA